MTPRQIPAGYKEAITIKSDDNQMVVVTMEHFYNAETGGYKTLSMMVYIATNLIMYTIIVNGKLHPTFDEYPEAIEEYNKLKV